MLVISTIYSCKITGTPDIIVNNCKQHLERYIFQLKRTSLSVHLRQNTLRGRNNIH